MDLTTLEIQIFVSLALVLGAVFVALLTDFLKGNNEALRERNVELVVRQQERERWLGRQAAAPARRADAPPGLAEPVVPAAPPEAGPVPATPQFQETQAPPIRIEPKPERWATEAELGEVDELVDRIRKRAAVNPIERPMNLDATGPASPEAKQPAAEPDTLDEPAARDLAQPEAVGGGSVSAELERLQEAAPAEPEPLLAPTVGVPEKASPEPAELGFETQEPEVPEPAASAGLAGETEEIAGQEAVRQAGEVAPENARPSTPPAEPESSEPPQLSWMDRLERRPGEPAETADSDRGEAGVSESMEPSEEVSKPEEEEAAPEPAASSGEPPSEGPVFGKVTPIDVLAGSRISLRESLPLGVEVGRPSGLDAAPDSEAEPGWQAESASSEHKGTAAPVKGSDDEAAKPAGKESGAGEAEGEEPRESSPSGLLVSGGAIRIPGQPIRSLGELQLPPGFHDYAVFAEALSSAAPFHGTVVALSATGAEEPEVLKEVEEFLRSLLTPVDFACRSGKDEFLLILPGETGAASQHRLQYIAQRLWDYQIRSVARHPIMFSWGAADMAGVRLSEVVGAARDRMWQTRRSRERATAELELYHRRVANET